MSLTLSGRVTVGADYVSRAGHRYRVVALAWDATHRRQAVVYQGQDGPDTGLWGVTSPAAFVAKFTPAEEAAPAPQPERPAGYVSTEGSNL